MFSTTHLSTSSTVSKTPSANSSRVTARLHARAVLPATTTPSALSDHQLLALCTQYGSQAKVWKQKFLGLLPEVDKRKLYLQAGCASVFEFAAKVGGVSREQVQRVFQLHQKFEATPELKQALVTGEVSVHKLSRVASIATPENQGFLLNQSKLLSQQALETLVKDTKAQSTHSVRTHTSNLNKTEKIAQSDELNLAPDVRQLLLNMQNKGIDHNQVLRDLLQERNERIQEKKQSLAQEIPDKEVKQQGNTAQWNNQPSRYIPQKVRQLLKQEYGDKCAHQQCVNKAMNIHHKLRFAVQPIHDPAFLVPLCKQHHEISHTLDVRVQEFRMRSLRTTGADR